MIFSHLRDPKDRIALTAVSKVFRDAEKADASLTVAPSALCELGKGFHDGKEHEKFLMLLKYNHPKGPYYARKWKKGLYWYRRAVENNDADVMFALDWCYMEGKGVKEDRPKACEWFSKASELGNGYATHRLSMCYASCGLGVEFNQAKEFELYIKGAEQVCLASANRLGYVCDRGGGGDCVEMNKAEALKWFRVAVELCFDDPDDTVYKLENELGRA